METSDAGAPAPQRADAPLAQCVLLALAGGVIIILTTLNADDIAYWVFGALAGVDYCRQKLAQHP